MGVPWFLRVLVSWAGLRRRWRLPREVYLPRLLWHFTLTTRSVGTQESIYWLTSLRRVQSTFVVSRSSSPIFAYLYKILEILMVREMSFLFQRSTLMCVLRLCSFSICTPTPQSGCGRTVRGKKGRKERVKTKGRRESFRLSRLFGKKFYRQDPIQGCQFWRDWS